MFKFTRVLQFNFEDEEGFGVDRITGRDIVELAEKIGANTISFFARDAWGRAFYDSKLMPKIARLGERSLLRELVEEARKRGISVVAMVGHTTNPELYSVHPDWAQVDREGKVISMDTDPAGLRREKMTWPLMCLNSPFLEHVKKEVEEVVSRGVDGVFLDSFRYMPDVDRACFCKYCLARFRGEFGLDPPREEDLESDFYRRSFEWRIMVNVRALREISKTLKRAGRGTPLIYNNHPLAWRGRANTIAELSREYVDIFFAECSEADYQPPGFIAEMVKLTRALTGKPVWASRNSFHTALTSQTTTPLAVRMGIRETFAGGGWPLFLVFASTYINGIDHEPVREAMEEVARLEEYMLDAEPLRYVGVVWSNRSRDWSGIEMSPHVTDSFRGFYYALLKEGLPVTYVSDSELDLGRFREYSALVLANTLSMSTTAIRHLEEYVRDGGGVIATYRAGFRDERGRSLEESRLLRILGLSSSGILKSSWSYVKVEETGHPVVSGVKGRTVLVGDFDKEFVDRRTPPELGWSVIVDGEGDVLAKVLLPDRDFGNEYENGRSPPPPVISTNHPGIVAGDRWVYFAFQPGRVYWRNGSPLLHDIIYNSVMYAAGPPPIRVRSTGFVELEAYRRSGQVLVHLLNHTYADRIVVRGNTSRNDAWSSTPESVHLPTRVVPLSDVKIEVRGFELRRVYEPLTGRVLNVDRKGGLSVVEAPLDEYRFLVFEVV